MAENENGAAKPAENTPSQTLFRFVSLRSPQLSDDKNQDKKFVLMPQEVKETGYFYSPVTNGTGSKKKLLLTEAANYATSSDCIAKEKPSNNLDTFKRTYRVIYDFAVWLARNKSTCTFEEFALKRDSIFAATYALPEKKTLWDNFIFQVVTQKDFYIKEVMMQMILALHTIQNPNQNEDQVKTLLAARIVLPKEMMMDDDSSSTSQTVSRLAPPEIKESFPTEEMQKQQKVASAKTTIDRFEKLKKNLVIAEKQYNKEYQEAYNTQKEAYEKHISVILQQYQDDVEKEKERFCSVRPSGTTYDPKDPCMQPKQIPYPNLPVFEVSFRDQISGQSLVTSLKTENLETILLLLEFDFYDRFDITRPTEEDIRQIDYLLEGRNTFAEIQDLIIESTERNNTAIVENTTGNEEMYVSIGGVVMPMARTVSEAFTFQLCPRIPYRLPVFDLALNVPDSSWDVSYADYVITSSSGSLGMNYYTKSRSGNTIFLKDLFKDGIDYSLAEYATINFKISFTNGNIVTFSASTLNYKTCTSGAFEYEVQEGEPPVAISDEDTFIPSGFGFKRIGIADYLKVEQTTHAYVEGEVANIENIMAREYREKSTRRLRRSENTTTSSSDTEREQLSDTTTANRFEMQSEIAKMMQESTDFGLNTSFSASYKLGANGSINAALGTNYANHKSKEESTRQAMTQSQDITSRAMDRIVAKVHEERIEKIIEEFEENNSHGFDNRKGDKHVVGVYRWVDKLMKNQIYNYGKRMMFEFAIPQPAKLYLLGANALAKFEKPIDPRTSNEFKMSNYAALNDETVLKYWSSKYNIALDELLADKKVVGYSFSDKTMGVDFVDRGQYNGSGRWAGFFSKDFEVPENYVATKLTGDITVRGAGWEVASGTRPTAILSIADKRIKQTDEGAFDAANLGTTPINVALDNLEEKVGLSLNTWDVKAVGGSVNIYCSLKPSYKVKWTQETFNKIIDAYENALVEYNNKIAEENAKADNIKGSNPLFYRQIEQEVLKHNCIAYLIDDNAQNQRLGKKMYTGNTLENFGVDRTNLDKYASLAKFMEQAFEWDIISYNLYPYYWANREDWKEMYNTDEIDPLFRSFLRSGMARVVATVRPGFEDAVQFYLATGKIWNGSEVPVIGDELYLSIVDEMKEPKGIKQGKAWLTRLPTTLNILQAESIGLKVAHALPFTTENPDDFEVPSEVITEDKFNFEKNDSVLGGDIFEKKEVQITFNYMDLSQFKTIGDLDNASEFPRTYECMGQKFEINRDARWKKTDSILKFYDVIADEITKIDGIEAYPSGKNGILFKIDINKVKNFRFSKPPHAEPLDILEFTTDGEATLKMIYPDGMINSIEDRITDKNGNNLAQEEYGNTISLSRFLV
ncbi:MULTISPECIES: hypothetical protein [unclassified Chryseobacterium]|uniref:hypothetical protein n=1 Tax=unclassified Chryseobacterium TaxID=2593645 RepID=UPI002269C92E|nr:MULTISPECIES: hypothetical protein [unclassified Chryseobacterium]